MMINHDGKNVYLKILLKERKERVFI